MTDVVERKIVLARPEERDRVEPFATPEYVPRRRLSLTFGDYPVLDANIVACPRIGPARDVSCREDLRNAGLEILIHRHAPIGLDPRLLGKVDQRFDSDPDHDQVGLD